MLCVTDDKVLWGLYGTQNTDAYDNYPMTTGAAATPLTVTTSKASYTFEPFEDYNNTDYVNSFPHYTIRLNSVSSYGTDTITLWYASTCGATAGCNGVMEPANTPFTITVNLPLPPPTISSITPASGPTAGGTAVTITGTNFSTTPANNIVKFGSATATVNNATATQLTVTTAASTAGTANVSVTVGSETAILSNAYTYVGPPVTGPVSATVGTGSSSNPITLALSGDAATSVSVVTEPSNGTATMAGTSITYTPAPGYVGSDGFTYRAGNEGGTSNTSTVTITVTATAVVLTPATGALPGTTVASAYSQTFSASGGVGPYSYSISAVPNGLLFNSASGTLSGTPTDFGTVNFTVTATDSSHGAGRPASDTKSYSLHVGAPTISVSPGTLTNPTAGVAYSQTISASGGATPHTFSVTSGTLPAGLTLNPATGVLSGTPTQAGSATFTIAATDNSAAGGFSGSQSYSVTVGAPTLALSPASLTSGVTGAIYSQSFTASAGNGPYSYSLTGTLPAGLTFDTGGVLSGTPTQAGTFNITVRATDSTTGSGAPFSIATTYTLTIGAPTITIAPATLPNATQGTAYSQNITASGGVGPHTFDITAGSVPDGLSLQTNGLLSGTPAATGTFNFTVTATDRSTGSTPFTYSTGYTITVGVAAVIVSPSALPGATIGASYSQTVTASGGTAPYALALTGALPAGLSFNTSTGVLSGMPTAAGSFSFSITATDSTGTPQSGSTNYSLAVGAPTIVVSPATLAGATLGSAYSQTITASGGVSPYSYSVNGTLPAGMTLDTSTGVLSGTPTTEGSSTFTIVATDSATGTGAPFQGAQAYTVATNLAVPVANAVSATVEASSSANAITLNITGGAAASVAVGTQASHGTATASGTTISYTPIAGYSGSDSFTYTATNTTGTSSPATVSITVRAPTLLLSPAAGALAEGKVGKAYKKTISASAGMAPYTYAVTAGSLPAGLTLDGATGAISGTPTAAANASFTVTATDANNATGSAAYTLVIKAPVVTFVFTPKAGNLGKTMAGEAYRQSITAKGGKTPLLYSIASGKLPKGMVLNVSTGELTGPLHATSAGDYSFTVKVTDNNGATGSAAYSLKVTPRKVTVADKVVTVPAGSTPADVYLNRDATGGPFTSAQATFVEPANAGTATIIQGELAQVGAAGKPAGWYLQFKPNPAFSGSAQVGYRLISALGQSNTGTVTYKLSHDVGKVAEDIDDLVHGFVQTRQNLIASGITVPGLQERRQMEQATDSVTARMTPSEEGMTARFSTSLAQMEAARDNADGVTDAASSPFNVWIDGIFLAHKRDENAGKWGSFAMVNLGADYLVSERALIGLSVHFDRMNDPSDADAELTGNGWLAGPYASIELGRGIFWDTSLLYGGSVNDIDTAFWDGDFDTKRWMLDTAIKGQIYLGEATVLTPKLRAVYFNEEVEDYTVRNGAGDEIAIEGFDEEQFRVSLGAEIARSFSMDDGSTVTPKLGVTAGYSGLDGSGAYASLTAGLTLETASLWMLDVSLLLNIEGDGQKSAGGKVGASKRF